MGIYRQRSTLRWARYYSAWQYLYDCRFMGVLAMKAKTRGTVSGLAALAVSFFMLRPAVELSAVLIRGQWPEAWFSGLIVWYADFFAAALSIAIAVVVGRYVLKRSA
jgi:hypothetical protein